MYFSLKSSYFQFLSTLRTLNLLINRAKIGQFQKTQCVLESSFYGLSDGNFKFDLSKLMKILFEKNCLKMVKNQFFVNFEGKNCNNRKNYVSFRKVFFRPFLCRFQNKKIPLGQRDIDEKLRKIFFAQPVVAARVIEGSM